MGGFQQGHGGGFVAHGAFLVAGDDEMGLFQHAVGVLSAGDYNSGKKKVEPDGSEGNVWFIRIISQTTGLTDLILVRTFSSLNDQIGLEP